MSEGVERAQGTVADAGGSVASVPCARLSIEHQAHPPSLATQDNAHTIQPQTNTNTATTQMCDISTVAPLSANDFELFENGDEQRCSLHGVIGLVACYRIYVDRIPHSRHIELSSCQQLFRCWLSHPITHQQIQIPTVFEFEPHKQYINALVDFAAVGNQLETMLAAASAATTAPLHQTPHDNSELPLANTTLTPAPTTLQLSIYYTPASPSPLPTSSSTTSPSPTGDAILGSPRSLLLETIGNVESRQDLIRTGVIGRGHYGCIYAVRTATGFRGALKEMYLPYELDKNGLEEEIRIQASFSHSFYNQEQNPFGHERYHVGLEHLLQRESLQKLPIDEPQQKQQQLLAQPAHAEVQQPEDIDPHAPPATDSNHSSLDSTSPASSLDSLAARSLIQQLAATHAQQQQHQQQHATLQVPGANAINSSPSFSSLPQPPHPADQSHLAQIYSAFLDPVSGRVCHLMQLYSGGDMERFIDAQAAMKEAKRKEAVRLQLEERDRKERAKDDERRQLRIRFKRGDRLTVEEMNALEEYEEEWADSSMLDDESDAYPSMDPDDPFASPPTPAKSQRELIQSTNNITTRAKKKNKLGLANKVSLIVPSPSSTAAARPNLVYQLPALWIRAWACQFCLALKALKSQKIVHADIAARNVYFTGNEYLTLAIGDFSVARRVKSTKTASAGPPKSSRTGPSNVKFRAIAPELVQLVRNADGSIKTEHVVEPTYASDLWSVGVVLLQCMLLLDCSSEDSLEWASWDENKFFQWIENQAAVQSNYPAAMWLAVKAMLRTDPTQRVTAEQAVEMWVSVCLEEGETETPRTAFGGVSVLSLSHKDDSLDSVIGNVPVNTLFNQLAQTLAKQQQDQVAQQKLLDEHLQVSALNEPQQMIGSEAEVHTDQDTTDETIATAAIIAAPASNEPAQLPPPHATTAQFVQSRAVSPPTVFSAVKYNPAMQPPGQTLDPFSARSDLMSRLDLLKLQDATLGVSQSRPDCEFFFPQSPMSPLSPLSTKRVAQNMLPVNGEEIISMSHYQYPMASSQQHPQQQEQKDVGMVPFSTRDNNTLGPSFSPPLLSSSPPDSTGVVAMHASPSAARKLARPNPSRRGFIPTGWSQQQSTPPVSGASANLSSVQLSATETNYSNYSSNDSTSPNVSYPSDDEDSYSSSKSKSDVNGSVPPRRFTTIMQFEQNITAYTSSFACVWYLLPIIDWFLPNTIRLTRPPKLPTAQLTYSFANATKLLYQARISVLYILLQLLASIALIVKEWCSFANHRNIDGFPTTIIMLSAFFCGMYLAYLKFDCADRSMHPRLGNLTIAISFVLLLYIWYEAHANGAAFHLVLFTISLLCFLLVKFRFGLVWHFFMITALVFNIVQAYQDTNDTLQAGGRLDKGDESIELFFVAIFLAIFVSVASAIMVRFQIAHTNHFNWALNQYTLRQNALTHSSMSQMQFMHERSREIEAPLQEMVETLKLAVANPAVNRDFSSLTATVGFTAQTQSLQLAHLNSLRLQSLLRDMLDTSALNQHRQVLAHREQMTRERTEEVERCVRAGKPIPPAAPLPTVHPASSYLSFEEKPQDFVRTLESCVKSLALAVARRDVIAPASSFSSPIVGMPELGSFKNNSKPDEPVRSSSPTPKLLLIPPYFGREVLLDLSPALYRDSRYLFDENRVARLIRSLIRNALAWGKGEETIRVVSQPRSFGTLKNGTPYVFVETSISFVPDYAALGSTILPQSFGLSSFWSPLDKINESIVEKMRGQVWMRNLQLDRKVPTAIPEASIHCVLMLKLNCPYDISPTEFSQSSASTSFERARSLMSSKGSIAHAQVESSPPNSTIPEATAGTNGQTTSKYAAPEGGQTTTTMTTTTKVARELPHRPTFPHLQALIVDPHPDARMNLLSRLHNIFGLQVQSAMNTTTAHSYLKQYTRDFLTRQLKLAHATTDELTIPGAVLQSPNDPLDSQQLSDLNSSAPAPAAPTSSLILFVNQRMASASNISSNVAMGGVEFIRDLIDKNPHWLKPGKRARAPSSSPSLHHVISFRDVIDLESPNTSMSATASSGGIPTTSSAAAPCPTIILLTSWSAHGPAVDRAEALELQRLAQMPLIRPIRFLSKPVVEPELLELLRAVSAHSTPAPQSSAPQSTLQTLSLPDGTSPNRLRRLL